MPLFRLLKILVFGTLLHRNVISTLVAVVVEPSDALSTRLIATVHLLDRAQIHAFKLVLVSQVLIIALKQVDIEVFTAS